MKHQLIKTTPPPTFLLYQLEVGGRELITESELSIGWTLCSCKETSHQLLRILGRCVKIK